MTSPLSGLKVLDMSRVLAGPFAGRMLCDLGADVVKVEPPDGDITRIWGRNVHGLAGYFFQQNAGKRGMCVDLQQSQGVELIKALATRADVLIENFRPDVMPRLGVGYDTLAQLNPRLIMLSISGFGAGGPESKRAAYAPIVHAEVGLLHRQALYSHQELTDVAQSFADTNASLHGLVGLLAALYQRERTGQGEHIDMAMIDASLVTDDQMHYALEDSYGTNAGLSRIWDTAGGPILISGDLRYIWHLLSKHYDIQDPSPPGADLPEKIRHRLAAADEFFKHTCADRAAVIAALDTMNLAWGDVRAPEHTQDNPTVRHRGSFAEVEDGAGGRRKLVQSPYRYERSEARVRGRAPHQGEHNRAVLRDWLDLSDAGIAEYASVLLEVARE